MTQPRSTVRAGLLAASLASGLLMIHPAGPAEALPTAPLRMVSIAPCRMADTRSSTMPSGYGLPNLTPGVPRSFVMTGEPHCLIPPDAEAVVVNVTAVASEGNGNLRLYPAGLSAPPTSTLNYRSGMNTANGAIIALGTGGALNVLASVSGTGVILDVTGYLTDQDFDALVFQGDWNPSLYYFANDLVLFAGSTYISLTPGNRGNRPDAGPPYWQVFAASGPAGPPGPPGPPGPQGPWTATVVNGRPTAALTSGTDAQVSGHLTIQGGKILYPAWGGCREGSLMKWTSTGLVCSATSQDQLTAGMGLRIEGPTPYLSLAQFGTTSEWSIATTPGDFKIRQNGTDRVTIKTNSGRVGFGTDPQDYLHLHVPDGNGGLRLTHGGAPGHYWNLESNFAGNFSIYHNTSKALMITNTLDTWLYGNVFLSGYGMAVGGWHQGSDARLKDHIATLDGALDRVLRLRGVEFEWKRDTERTARLSTGRQIGLIAQEVEAVLPEVVATDSEGYKSVAYANLTGLLIEAIKEQQGTIERQTGELEEQRKETDALAARLARLERALAHTVRD